MSNEHQIALFVSLVIESENDESNPIQREKYENSIQKVFR